MTDITPESAAVRLELIDNFMVEEILGTSHTNNIIEWLGDTLGDHENKLVQDDRYAIEQAINELKRLQILEVNIASRIAAAEKAARVGALMEAFEALSLDNGRSTNDGRIHGNAYSALLRPRCPRQIQGANQ